MMYKIRKLHKSEILQLRDLPPEDWQLDLPALVSLHFGRPYFCPVAAVQNNEIVGCGNSYFHGKIGWLGNIIVRQEYRRQGIGRALTCFMIKYLKSRGCTTQLLIATEMGKNIYTGLGFRKTSTYYFYKRRKHISRFKNLNVRKIKENDLSCIKRMDREISGEDRFAFLKRFLTNAWIYPSGTSSEINGFYLPEYGNGLIMAKSHEAGIELMRLRLNDKRRTAVVPATNKIANEFLESLKFENYRSAPRMALGPEIHWQPDMIYNRGSGYSG